MSLSLLGYPPDAISLRLRFHDGMQISSNMYIVPTSGAGFFCTGNVFKHLRQSCGDLEAPEVTAHRACAKAENRYSPERIRITPSELTTNALTVNGHRSLKIRRPHQHASFATPSALPPDTSPVACPLCWPRWHQESAPGASPTPPASRPQLLMRRLRPAGLPSFPDAGESPLAAPGSRLESLERRPSSVSSGCARPILRRKEPRPASWIGLSTGPGGIWIWPIGGRCEASSSSPVCDHQRYHSSITRTQGTMCGEL